MKKYRLVITLVMVTMLTLAATGCGKTDEMTKQLCGQWGYVVDSIDGECYQIYKFHKNGTYKSIWDNKNASWKSAEDEGTYVINTEEIILTDDEGELDSVIEYDFEGGVLTMVDRHSDGSGYRILTKLK